MTVPPSEIDNIPRSPDQARRSARLSKPLKKYGVLSRLRSYLFFDPLIWLYTIVLGTISIPVFLSRDKERVLHGFARFWSKLIMKTIASPVTVTGLDEIDISKPYIYAVNHGSALDIPILYAYLPFQFRIAFKKDLLSYPIVGWHLKRAGQICIDQQNPAAAIGSIRKALKALKDGIPLVIFPEGGRTPDGEIKPFLGGAFFLAISAKVDVVPVALVGTFELLPMDTYHIKCQPVKMRIGKPISTAGYAKQDMEKLSGEVQKAMEDLYYRNAATVER